MTYIDLILFATIARPKQIVNKSISGYTNKKSYSPEFPTEDVPFEGEYDFYEE